MSDIHLSDKAPTARLEQNTVGKEYADAWWEVMSSVLQELRIATMQRDVGLPLIIAGDLFDVPSPSVGLVRMVYEELPEKVYAVAGQHDLPNHSMDELGASGLGLLVSVKAVEMLSNMPTDIGGLQVYGFSWERPYTQPFSRGATNVAVIHRYCWKEGKSFPGCKEEDHVNEQRSALLDLGYSSACWGDNHRGFTHGPLERDRWVNCGVAIPRNVDFQNYVPHYYYLLSNGTFEMVPFKTKHYWQPWVDEDKTADASQKVLDFTKEIAKLVGRQTCENFLDELQEAMVDLKDEGVRKKVWEILQMAEESVR